MASLFNKRYKTYRLQDVTEDMILNAEKYFEVKLPGNYIALLKEQNGGTLKFNEYPIVGSSSQGNKLIIDHIMGIGANDEEGILQTTYYLAEWDLPKGLILLCGDGHSWVALDYRNTKSDPPVIFIDTETDELINLANNFAGFLENFTEHEKVSKKANKKKYIFTDIRFNVEIDKKDPMDSIMNIELYCDEEVKYKYNGNIFENFTNKVIPRKSLFVKWLEIVEKFFNQDGEVHISVNDYEKTLILKHNKNKDHLIIKENRRILGYYPEIKGFFQAFNNQLLLAKEKIKESKISKDF
ncbi:hypothetical protein ASG65_00415 [Bacillus sp. Leaf13]|nr:hypothetical protein ASG65_00415 [Bacillus sp. Leaf13]